MRNERGDDRIQEELDGVFVHTTTRYLLWQQIIEKRYGNAWNTQDNITMYNVDE